ncbi:hypothetical protein ACHOLT_00515 [Desulfitobacterium sp. Sab5]|uniref:hypothetical protein n=1 Tax=Desulfitobacterium nosdiversum TaxID=3375356 RepID=UPI003CE6E2FB
MNIPILALLLQGIPELIAVVTLSFVIARIPLNWKQIVEFALILAFFSYLIRLTPLPFGLHIILLIILLSSMLIKISNGNLSLSLIACIVSYMTLGILELASLSLLMPVFHLTTTEIYTNEWIRILVGEPHVILLFIFAFLLNRFLAERRKNHGFSSDKSGNCQ